MSNIIDVLETLATDASLINEQKIIDLLADTELTNELKTAIETGDVAAIQISLNARAKIFCGILPAEDDEQEEQQDDDSGTESKLAVNS